MIVISDTSPINYLLQIGLIDLLHHLFGKVIIPRAVYEELQHKGAPKVVSDWTSKLPDWVEVQAVSNPDPGLDLGAGEREAITLALSLNADALLLDERKGRREALVRGVTVSGTLSVLEQAAERGLVDLSKAFGAVLQTNFRASTEIIQAMLQRDANRKLSTGQEQDSN